MESYLFRFKNEYTKSITWDKIRKWKFSIASNKIIWSMMSQLHIISDFSQNIEITFWKLCISLAEFLNVLEPRPTLFHKTNFTFFSCVSFLNIFKCNSISNSSYSITTKSTTFLLIFIIIIIIKWMLISSKNVNMEQLTSDCSVMLLVKMLQEKVRKIWGTCCKNCWSFRNTLSYFS